MKRKALLSAIALLFTLTIFAQKPDIKFTDLNYDFGTVSEEDGKVQHVFEFTNTGTSDLVLTNVQASCGCTTPQWSREPIAPKAKGTITVTYAAAGRPGPFTKTITVTSNADKQVLIIKGTVTPKGQKVEDIYPVVIGDVRIKSESVNFGDVASGESKIEKFSLVNMSAKDITVSFEKLPDYITAEKVTLKANEKGNISVTFNGAKTKEWGTISKQIKLVVANTKDKTSQNHDIIAVASVFEKFTEEQKANAPVVDVVRELNVGEIKVGEKKTVKIAVKNTGKSPLFIRNASSSFADIVIKAPKGGIKPGKSDEIKVTIDASKAAASQYNKYISLQFNDPNNAKRTVALIYTVAAAPVKK